MSINSTVFVKHNNSWRSPKNIWVNDSGAWKEVKKVWIKNGGTWKECVPAAGSATFTENGTFTVPTGVHHLYVSAIGGGGSAGNVVDGGRNDDFGGSGGGSSGQKVVDYKIEVYPGETIAVTIGAAGGRASGTRDRTNQGGAGGSTSFNAGGKIYSLLGGTGGKGGVGSAGNIYSGTTQISENDTFNFENIIVNGGNSATSGIGGAGGAGFNGVSVSGGRYGSVGSTDYHPELNATDYGGGGAGAWSDYIREDNGHSPCWGGLGKSGYARFYW